MPNLASIIALTIAGALVLLAALLFLRLKAPESFPVLPLKLIANAWGPILAVGSAAAALIILLVAQQGLAFVLALLAAIVFAAYTRRVTAPQTRFDKAFGEEWWRRIRPEQGSKMLARRWTWRLPKPAGAVEVERRVVFWTIPGGGQQLTCDVWKPAAGNKPTGKAVVALHAPAWYLFPARYPEWAFARYLAGEGHVVMVVHGRPAKQATLYERLADAQRAVEWMKDNAARYGAQPDQVTLLGASEGGQIALLAAYSANQAGSLTPNQAADKDQRVAGVIALYAPLDVAQSQDKTGGPLRPGSLHDPLAGLGMTSPIEHAQAGSPPTLLIQGEHDLINPHESARALTRKLRDAGVPVINIVFPLTEHAFDLAYPEVSPSAQAALYYIERFLALV